MTRFHSTLRSPLRPQREKDWTPAKDQSKTQKMHQELPKQKQQNQEDPPHHSDSQWVVVSTDWEDFNLTRFPCLQELIEWIYCIHKGEKNDLSKEGSSVGNYLSLSVKRRVFKHVSQHFKRRFKLLPNGYYQTLNFVYSCEILSVNRERWTVEGQREAGKQKVLKERCIPNRHVC